MTRLLAALLALACAGCSWKHAPKDHEPPPGTTALLGQGEPFTDDKSFDYTARPRLPTVTFCECNGEPIDEWIEVDPETQHRVRCTFKNLDSGLTGLDCSDAGWMRP